MNEYSDSIQKDQAETLRGSLMAAGNGNADQEAALQKLAARTGVPVEAVRMKKPEIELQDRLNTFDYDKAFKESPKLSTWLADPKNAAIAHDDWENLSGIERTFRYGKDYAGSLAGGVVGDTVGRTLSGAGELYGVAVRSLDRAMGAVMPKAVMDVMHAPIPTPWFVDPEQILKRPGAQLKAAGDYMKPAPERQTLGTDVAGGIGQIGGQIAVFFATGGTLTTASMMTQGADIMAEKTAKDIADPAMRDTAILAGGAITAITEKYGLAAILNRVPPEVKNRTLRFIADKVAAGGIEAGQEFAEGLLHDIARKTLTNKDAELLQGAGREMSAAALSAAIVRTALGVKGHGRAKQQEDFVRALTDQAGESKLRERMPAAFKNYLDQITAGGPVENVFIPADRFSEYFQTAGLDPAVEASRLGAQNFAEASLAGGDVMISTSDFVTQMSGSDHLQGLWNDLRFQQGDMTLREANEFEKNRGDEQIDDETLQRMTGAVPQASGYNAVKEQIMGELAGRFDHATADGYATQYAAVLSTLAERAGVEPQALADVYKLDVTMPVPDALRKMLDRVDIDLDPVIDRLRAGDVPAADTAYGDSLTEFVRKNGLREVGEVRSLNETVGRKPGKKNIVRADGLSLDAALQNAVEAGYFPGREASELTESDLVDALYEDAGGNKQYSSHNANDAAVSELRMIESLGEYLHSIGADVGAMSNAEIKARMRADSAQGVADVYDQAGIDMVVTTEPIARSADDQFMLDFATPKGAADTTIRAVIDGKEVGYLDLQVGEDGKAVVREVRVNPSNRRQGVATALYDAARAQGFEIQPGDNQTADGAAFRAAYDERTLFQSAPVAYTREQLEMMDTDDLDRMAFGHAGGDVIELAPSEISLQYDDVENAEYKFEQGGMAWAKSVDLSEPVDVEIHDDGKFYLADGHHRWFAAGKTGRKLQAKIDVKANPINEILRQQDAKSYEQNTGNKRGSITIGANRKMTISLFEKADLSTFLHETGHFYLEVMGDLATRADANPQIVEDFNKILGWMGIASRDQIETKHHEMFARANEAYLMEGNAPSGELRAAFQRFKSWLMMIYKTVAALNVELSPDLRAVFDRMYATDQQIEAAQNETNYEAMFATAADAGMSQMEFDAYLANVGQTIEQGRENLQTKMMQEMLRERTKQWKAAREVMRTDVAAEVDAEPVYQAFAALTTGLTEGGIEVKLSRDALVREFGKPFLNTLPRSSQRLYAAEGGVDTDTAAEIFGFDSGRSLIEALANMKPRAALIEQITQDRMIEKHGDIRFDGTIAEEAIAALHNDKREDVLKIELRAIRRKAAEVAPLIRAKEQAARAESQAGEQFVEDALPTREMQGRTKAGAQYSYRAFDPEPMKRAAAGMIGQKQIRDLRPHGYLLAERNAAKLGAKAMKAKDYMTAAEQKQRELFNHYLYKEATRVAEEVERKSNWLADQGKQKKREALGKAGADYLEQVDDILERYEFKQVPLNKLRKRESLAAWVDQQEALGNAVSVPEEVLNEARRVNWKQIPVDELRAVYDSVKNITHLAGLKNKLIIKGKQRDFAEVIDELLAAGYSAPLNSTGELSLPNMSGATLGQRIKKNLRGYDAAHIKVEQIISWLDNGDIDGAWARNFFDLAADAQTAEYDLHREVTMALDQLRRDMPSEWRGSLFDKVGFDLPQVTGEGTAVMTKPTRFTLLSIALNMGNENNLQRLRDGNRFTEAQLQQVRDALTDADLKFVQGTWDAIEKLWPQMAALEKRASGLVPQKVEAASFEVRGQIYRGGYFPLVYDSRIARAGEKQIETDMTVEQFAASGFGRPSTNKGATKKRMDVVNQPLLLDMNDVIGGHIAKVVKDISHREAVMGLHNILMNGEIKVMLIDRLGEAYYRELRNWAQVLVNDRSDTMNAAKGAAKWAMVARTNLSIMVMGWKFSTAFSQFAGFGPAMDLVSPKFLSHALAQATRNPVQTWAMVSEKSGEMRNRVATIDRDVRDAMRRLADKTSHVADVQRTAFIFTSYADRMVSVPTWLGAYNQAISEGKPEDAAVRAGDRAVRLSQGAGGAKDLAAVQRNNELMRLMTMFYTPFSALYARLRDVGHQQAVQGIGYLPKAVARILALVALPAVLGDILAGRGPDEDEDEVWWAMRKMMLYPVAALPGVRDFAAIIDGMIIETSGEGQVKFPPSYQLSPIVGAIQNLVKRAIVKPVSVLNGNDEWDADATWDLFESVGGMVYGLPTAQTRITGEYLQRLMTGDAEPENAPELMQGLLFRQKPPPK